MIQPSNPLIFSFRFRPPALKNDRELIETKEGEKKLIKSPRVVHYIEYVKTAIRAQLNERFGGAWELIQDEVACYALISCKYASQFPSFDVDNMWTTVQECLQGTVIEDDNQIMYFTPVRLRVASEKSEGVELFVWSTRGFYIKEQIEFFKFLAPYDAGRIERLEQTENVSLIRPTTFEGF